MEIEAVLMKYENHVYAVVSRDGRRQYFRAANDRDAAKYTERLWSAH